MALSGRILLISTFLQGLICEEWSAWVPSTISALKGHCVVLPCKFTYPGKQRSSDEFDIAWYCYHSTSYPAIFHKNKPVNVISDFMGRTRLFGDLGNKDCSLLIDNVRGSDQESYYVWIDPDTVSYKFYQKTVRLQMTDTLSPQLENTLEFVEGKMVNITCSIEHTCPLSLPKLSWSHKGDSVQEKNITFSENSWKLLSVLTFTPLVSHHGQLLVCSCTFPRNATAQIILDVKYEPIILPESSCSYVQANVTCWCVTDANPLPSVVWKIGDRNITGQNQNYSVSSSISGHRYTSMLMGQMESTVSISCLMENKHGFSLLQLNSPTTDDSHFQIWIAASSGGLLLIVICVVILYKTCHKWSYSDPGINADLLHSASEKQESGNLLNLKAIHAKQTDAKTQSKSSNLYLNEIPPKFSYSKQDCQHEDDLDIYENSTAIPQAKTCDEYENIQSVFQEQDNVYMIMNKLTHS